MATTGGTTKVSATTATIVGAQSVGSAAAESTPVRDQHHRSEVDTEGHPDDLGHLSHRFIAALFWPGAASPVPDDVTTWCPVRAGSRAGGVIGRVFEVEGLTRFLAGGSHHRFDGDLPRLLEHECDRDGLA